jgi:glycosyltransferase involved in cell wall biosynthesis
MQLEEFKISVITCTYNSEKFLETNLSSVWNGYPPHEQIIVDARSSDNTIRIIQKYINRGNNIKILNRKPNGISDAMNYGIQSAKGDIIQILHSDDYIIYRKIFPEVIELFNKYNSLWLYGLTKTVDSFGENIGEQPPKFISRYRYWLLPFINYVPHPSLFIRKEAFIKYGFFDEKLKIIMDWDYWLRIGKNNIPVVINKYWCAFRMHTESLSTREEFSGKLHMEEKKVLNKNFFYPFAMLIYICHKLLYFIRYNMK